MLRWTRTKPNRFQTTHTSRWNPANPTSQLCRASANPPELTLRSITWGVVLCVIFTIASAYSGLKVGQVMEAAIPISILAIGMARVYKRRSSLLENVIITGIGGAAGGVVAGAIFTLPALYILNLDPHPVQTIFICLAGGCLGVLFLIPLRRYFVREMHGELPYPEATAITEVLVTGEKGGSQARLLLQATGHRRRLRPFRHHISGVEGVSSIFSSCPVMASLADGRRMVFRFDAIGFILGLGYVMGLRSSMILCAGGVLSNFVLVPVIWFIGSHISSRGISRRDSHFADDRRQTSIATMCASSAWARLRPRESSASFDRCRLSPAHSALRCAPSAMAKPLRQSEPIAMFR